MLITTCYVPFIFQLFVLCNIPRLLNNKGKHCIAPPKMQRAGVPGVALETRDRPNEFGKVGEAARRRQVALGRVEEAARHRRVARVTRVTEQTKRWWRRLRGSWCRGRLRASSISAALRALLPVYQRTTLEGGQQGRTAAATATPNGGWVAQPSLVSSSELEGRGGVGTGRARCSRQYQGEPAPAWVGGGSIGPVGERL